MKLLLIEDDPIDKQIIFRALERTLLVSKNNVIWCSSLAEGLAELEKNSFDVIITDLGLPDENGPVIVEHLESKSPTTPILVTTNDDREATSKNAFNHGAEDFIYKPDISGSLLNRCILFAIERKKLKNSLALSTREANKASKAKTDFLANMSHEIRTPLNLIIGSADLLLETTLTNQQQKLVESFQTASNHLVNLISNILDMSKIEAGGMSVVSADYDLDDLVDSVADIVSIKCREKKLNFEYYIDPSIKKLIHLDGDKVKQILFNLLNNSIKFTEQGYVKLNVQQEGQHLLLTVEDSGLGIPMDKRSNIFTSFYQIGSNDQKVRGTGLGLTIVREFVNLLKGQITLDPNYTKGTRFLIKLPLSFAKEERPQERNKNFTGKDVLVMAHLESERQLLTENFKLLGANVTTLDSGEKLAKIFQESKSWDHYILDIQMHDKGALQLLSEKNFLFDNSKLTFLLPQIHRANDIEIIQNFKGAGFIYKPISVKRVMSAFNESTTSEQATPSSLEPKSLKVLVAEDDFDNRALVEAYLKKSPHKLVFANDGKECVKKFRHDNFDIILMDIQMPHMDGLQATEAIRKLESTLLQDRVSTPIVALSANAFKEDRDKAKASGFTGYLTKPIRLKTLNQLLDDVCQNKKNAAMY